MALESYSPALIRLSRHISRRRPSPQAQVRRLRPGLWRRCSEFIPASGRIGLLGLDLHLRRPLNSHAAVPSPHCDPFAMVSQRCHLVCYTNPRREVGMFMFACLIDETKGWDIEGMAVLSGFVVKDQWIWVLPQGKGYWSEETS
jgi:hypothetical protein